MIRFLATILSVGLLVFPTLGQTAAQTTTDRLEDRISQLEKTVKDLTQRLEQLEQQRIDMAIAKGVAYLLRQRIATLIEQLGDENFEVREKASQELIKIGTPALDPLREAAKNPSPEIAARAQRIIKEIEVAKAWSDAGAHVGWMKIVPPRQSTWGFWDPWRSKAEAEAIPAFRFPERNAAGLLAKLPDPGMPFGLDFHCGFYARVELKELAHFKNLQSLSIGGVQGKSYADLKELAALKELRGLYLFHTQVTDAQLKHLAGLKKLQTLDLMNTPVTDAGLKELAGLKNLQWLHLRGTKVTAKGIAALKKELPACKIVVAAEPEQLEKTHAHNQVERDLTKGVPGVEVQRLLKEMGFEIAEPEVERSFSVGGIGGLRTRQIWPECKNPKTRVSIYYLLESPGDKYYLAVSHEEARRSALLGLAEKISPKLEKAAKEALDEYERADKECEKQVGKLTVRVNKRGMALESHPPPRRTTRDGNP